MSTHQPERDTRVMTVEGACTDVTDTDRPCTLLLGHRGTHTPRWTVTEILELEREHPTLDRVKQQILSTAGLTPARYYQWVVALTTDQTAAAADPFTVARITRSIQAARTSRAARHLPLQRTTR